MKFFEYFDKSSNSRDGLRGLILTGEDSSLVDVVSRDFLQRRNIPEVETVRVTDLRQIGQLLGEGSFFGPRCFDMTIAPKAKTPAAWKEFSDQVKRSQHSLVIRFESGTGIPTDLSSRSTPLVAVVDCRFPKTTKEKVRFVHFRPKGRGCTLDDEVAKELASRIKTATDLESAALVLGLVHRSRGRVTLKDLDRFFGGGSGSSGVSSHALLTGNVSALGREIDTLEPMLLLTAWNAILRRFYCWLCEQTNKKEDLPAIEDDEDEESSIKVNRFQMRDYAVAQKSYSRVVVREVMEELNDLYQDLRRGRSGAWKERARLAVQKLAVKA